MSRSESPTPQVGQGGARRLAFVAETIQANGCSIDLCRLDGPEARELFFSCRPTAAHSDAGQQAEAIYRAISNVLIVEGGSVASLVSETLFYRHLRANIKSVRAARKRVVGANKDVAFGPALTEIEQAPLNEQALLELSAHALIPSTPSTQFVSVRCPSTCECAECLAAQGLMIHIGDETRLHTGGLYGIGEGAFQQTQSMFDAAETMLQQAGMQFSDVVRTWIYLREMDRDYAELNRARRQFFDQRKIAPPPASTGIGAGLVPDEHDLCLCVYAVKGGQQPLVRTLMTTPTLNEAPSYGADFSRGMRVEESNKHALYISGTASLDETGQSVHENDLDAQAERMLVNIATLLEAQGAGIGDIVSAITYLKNPADTQRFQEKLRAAGYAGFAHTLVVAPVCRPELLCETEVLAVLAKDAQI